MVSSTRSRATRTTDCENGPSLTTMTTQTSPRDMHKNRQLQSQHGNSQSIVSLSWKSLPLAVLAVVTVILVLTSISRQDDEIVQDHHLESSNKKHKHSQNDVESKRKRISGKHDMNLRLTNNGKNATTGTNFNGFSFFLMGDTPYRDWQAKRLELQMKEMKDFVRQNPQRNVSFTVHVGDLQKVQLTKCDESAYKLASDILRKGPLPTLVVPGDNDYYDCPSRDESFKLFLKYFGSFEQKWHKADWERLNVIRSDKNRELFVFIVQGILIIGIHLINAPADHEEIRLWDARMSMNVKWVSKSIEQYMKSHEIRGVILLGHALRSPRTRPFFLQLADHFVNITHRQDLPVLYVHGDGHDWDVDTKLAHQLHWKYFRDIQVDQGGLADPVIVDVAPQVKGKTHGLKVSNDMQHSFGHGLFRIDQQRGLYKNPRSIDDKRT